MKVDETVQQYLRMNPGKCPSPDALFRYDAKTGRMIEISDAWLIVAGDESVGIATRPHVLRQASRKRWVEVGSGAEAEVWTDDDEWGFVRLPLNPPATHVFGDELRE